jgi:CDP-diacylglycerol--glycerol-3-phosphate 3-phosphatidyltransferase
VTQTKPDDDPIEKQRADKRLADAAAAATSADAAAAALRRNRIWTIPNLFCAIRLAGTPVLVALAWFEQPVPFVVLLLLLVFTDWIDGRLARWLNQQSDFGARLDSVADITLFAALLVGAVLLKGRALLGEWPWIAATLASYALSCAAGIVKFRRFPSYHTRIAKLSSYLVILGAVLYLAEFTPGWFTPWPFRCAMLTVTLGNLEATAITCLLPRWQANVLSLRAAMKRGQ